MVASRPCVDVLASEGVDGNYADKIWPNLDLSKNVILSLLNNPVELSLIPIQNVNSYDELFDLVPVEHNLVITKLFGLKIVEGARVDEDDQSIRCRCCCQSLLPQTSGHVLHHEPLRLAFEEDLVQGLGLTRLSLLLGSVDEPGILRVSLPSTLCVLQGLREVGLRGELGEETTESGGLAGGLFSNKSQCEERLFPQMPLSKRLKELQGRSSKDKEDKTEGS